MQTMRPVFGTLQWPLHLALLWLFAATVQADSTHSAMPQPIGYVSDFAKVIAPADERRLAAISEELERKTDVIVRVVTVPSLDGLDIEDFSRFLLESWMDSGQATKTILIVDAVADKRMRVSLGDGLNRMVTPAVSETVQRQVMMPLLSRGHRGEAFVLAITEFSVAIGRSQHVALYSVPGYTRVYPASFSARPPVHSSTNELLLFIPLLIFMVSMARLETKMARATVVFEDVFRANLLRRRSKSTAPRPRGTP
ncbi:MAG: TPM domain-containing protein [Calditrichaeota bacterium]|nr:TPM domain-containing protein [Calditrichota bacterium]